mmetsp:Transcript_76233/g.199982  ORF Transcript_76233/g.199982 Transcript_76233/m.199982 type:complete len:304 (-) Transcript_76233:225-1136(-)
MRSCFFCSSASCCRRSSRASSRDASTFSIMSPAVVRVSGWSCLQATSRASSSTLPLPESASSSARMSGSPFSAARCRTVVPSCDLMLTSAFACRSRTQQSRRARSAATMRGVRPSTSASSGLRPPSRNICTSTRLSSEMATQSGFKGSCWNAVPCGRTRGPISGWSSMIQPRAQLVGTRFLKSRSLGFWNWRHLRVTSQSYSSRTAPLASQPWIGASASGEARIATRLATTSYFPPLPTSKKGSMRRGGSSVSFTHIMGLGSLACRANFLSRAEGRMAPAAFPLNPPTRPPAPFSFSSSESSE